MSLCYFYGSRLSYTFICTRCVVSYKLINFFIC
nr:MAG TPA: hypothetical protein [Caudoviricetes sp.]